MRKLLFTINAMWIMPLAVLALWAEPSCDPAVDPTTCNISAPLNVSSSDQTKNGGLAINGTLTANGPSIFASAGTLTADGPTLIRGPLTVQNTTIFSNPYTVAVNGEFIYSGAAGSFILTADSIDDSEVSNILTASNFVADGATNAVDLDSLEVAGTLPAVSVEDAWVNTSGDIMTGTLSLTPASGDALAITANTSNNGIDISGFSGEPLISLNPTGTGRGLYVNSSVGYPIYVNASASASRGVNVVNNAIGGYGVYATASSAINGTGVFGSGITYGVFGLSSSGRGIYGESSTGYGGYFTSDGDQSTALYAENTNTTAGFSKYGIQTTATTTTGVGIYAVSDYGRAGHFESNSGGTGVYVDAVGGTYGVDIKVSDFGTAIQTNGGTIDNDGAYLGGQFYPNELPGNGVYEDIDPTYVFAESLGSNDPVGDMIFDGSSLWIGRTALSSTYSSLEHRALSDGREMNSSTMTWSDDGELVLANDTVYYFSDAASYETINRLDGSTGSGSLSSSFTIKSAVFDGNNIWFGSSSTIREWSNLSTLSTRISGTGSIVDIIFADGYVWAVDSTNDLVRKLNTTSPYSNTTITVGNNPQAAVYDGQYIWVANYTGNSLTRINTADNSTNTYDVSSLGSGPQDLVFDGANIWIAYDTSGIGAFNIASETMTKENNIAGTDVTDLLFDGTYVWAASADYYLFKLAIGGGFGTTVGGLTDGILMYNTSGAIRCLYVSGTTVTASSTLTNCQ